MESKRNKKDELKRLYREGTIDITTFSSKLGEIELQEKPVRDNMANKKSWTYQNKIIESFEKEGRPTINDIITKVNLLKKQRYKALFALLYLTAARISEIVKITTKRHLEQEIKRGRPFLIVRLENRKNRQRKFKEILIPLDYPAQEKELANIVILYIEKKDKDEILFPITKNAAHHYFKKYIGWNCHLIRHLRCTHLMTMYGIDPELLKKMAGWSDLRPAKYYINLVTDDLIDIFPKENSNKELTDEEKYEQLG